LPYLELSGGVQIDGSYSAQAFRVFKEQGHFVLPAQGSVRPENIVGWKDYTTIDNGRWLFTRSSDYTYIYNNTEIR